ncbi:hypothetical protein ACJX0J_037770, partial [Zea mays]
IMFVRPLYIMAKQETTAADPCPAALQGGQQQLAVVQPLTRYIMEQQSLIYLLYFLGPETVLLVFKKPQIYLRWNNPFFFLHLLSLPFGMHDHLMLADPGGKFKVTSMHACACCLAHFGHFSLTFPCPPQRGRYPSHANLGLVVDLEARDAA